MWLRAAGHTQEEKQHQADKDRQEARGTTSGCEKVAAGRKKERRAQRTANLIHLVVGGDARTVPQNRTKARPPRLQSTGHLVDQRCFSPQRFGQVYTIFLKIFNLFLSNKPF